MDKKHTVKLAILLVLTSTAAQAQVTQSSSPSEGPWARYEVVETACGLVRSTPDFKMNIVVAKDQSHSAMSISSATWNLVTGTQYRVWLLAGTLSRDAAVLAISMTSVFFELPQDKDFQKAVAEAESLTIRSLIPFNPNQAGVGDLKLPLDHGAQALELLAACGIPKASNSLLRDSVRDSKDTKAGK